MKHYLIPLALLCLVAMSAHAATKTLTVLGGTKIKAVYDGNLPKTAESNGVRTDVSGFALNGGKLVRALGFEFKSDAAISSVRVEDVTGREAVLVVSDSSPKLTAHRWKGSGEPQAIGKTTTSWVFEKGDATIVYRFTVQIEGVPEPVVIYQPAVFPESAKAMLIMVANAKKG